MSTDGQGTKWHRNIAENVNRLSRAHERYSLTTELRQHIADVNESPRSLKIAFLYSSKNIAREYLIICDSAAIC